MQLRVEIALAVFVAVLPPAALSSNGKACPVTLAPSPSFVPPSPWTNDNGSFHFLIGTPSLWAPVSTKWRVHDGTKLPYFSVDFNGKKESGHPPLSVVARRLDEPEPLIWASWTNGAYLAEKDLSFMVTGLTIPSAGCWQISAHYILPDDKVQTLTYTIWVEP